MTTPRSPDDETFALQGLTVFVTGGTGFLGSHVVPLLVAKGAKVVVMARDATDTLEYKRRVFFGDVPREEQEEKSRKVECVRGSVEDKETMSNEIKRSKPTILIHMAGIVLHSRKGPNPPHSVEEMNRVNVQGSINAMEVAIEEGVKRSIFLSTSGVVGCSSSAPVVPPNDDSEFCTETVGKWPYYFSKIEMERRVRGLALSSRCPVVFLRPSMILGPGDQRLRSSQTVISFLQQRIPVVPGGGVSFVDVRDVAQAVIKAIEAPTREVAYKGFLLGSANWTLPEFFDRLEDVSGVPAPKVRVPSVLVVAGARVIDHFQQKRRFLGMPPHFDPHKDPVRAEMSSSFWYIDSSLASRVLDFHPRDPLQTLYDTVQYLLDRGAALPPARL